MKEIKIIKKGDKSYPKKLLEIKKPPEKLYALGDISLLNKTSITIVGSRDCTEYGYNQAIYFSKEIAKQNICIVSGMAIGIDSAAHNGAKNEIGKTVAVLGSGFNHIFPKENEDLFYEILEEGGCVISEYAPEVEKKSKNFPERNRIVSGLSEGVLVVEAKCKSGSNITARLAKEQKKKVFCIPSNIDSKTGIGTSKLIQNGAKLVISPKEILQEIGVNAELDSNVKSNNKNNVRIKKEYKPVYDVLSKVPINITEICKRSGKSIVEVTSILTMLEIEETVKQVGVNEFVRI